MVDEVLDDFLCCALGALVAGGVLGCVVDEVVVDVLCCTPGVVLGGCVLELHRLVDCFCETLWVP